jgi:hypothetical protein
VFVPNLKKNEGRYFYLNPLLIKISGPRYSEWASTWRLENVLQSIGVIEISNPYFDYFKRLPLSIVRNVEGYGNSQPPYRIEGILNLYAWVVLDGYKVIVKPDEAKLREYHYRNYRADRTVIPQLIPLHLRQRALYDACGLNGLATLWDNL